MALVHIDWRPDPAALRSFGRTAFIGLALIAAVLAWGFDKEQAALTVLVIGAVFGAAGLTGSRWAWPVYWVWMAPAFVIGSISSFVLMAALYYIAVTATALLARLCGRDRLRLKRRNVASHWVDLPPPATLATDAERQF